MTAGRNEEIVAAKPMTLGELRSSGYKVQTVKHEMRRNLIAKMRKGEKLFPGILGFEDTVIPQLENAILSGQDIIMLGERGQAKSRLIRSLVSLLDDEIPIIAGSEVNDDPFGYVVGRPQRCKPAGPIADRGGRKVSAQLLAQKRRRGLTAGELQADQRRRAHHLECEGRLGVAERKEKPLHGLTLHHFVDGQHDREFDDRRVVIEALRERLLDVFGRR